MSFPPTARIDTRLTVIDWPDEPDEELATSVESVTTFELANDAPAVLHYGSRTHLAWRGFLTGGLLTLYERLGGLISERGLAAFYADPRLEVFVPPRGEVVVLGAMRFPVHVARAEWDARVAAADSGDDLAADFIRAAIAGSSEVIAEARRAAEEDEELSLVARIPEAIEQHPPGVVDFELLEDADFELTERFDPEGIPDDTWVSCRVLRWRTDFLPPGMTLDPDRHLDDTLSWRVAQWEWTADTGDEAGSDEDDVDWGDWVLRARSPVDISVVSEHLPDALQEWLRRATRDAIAMFDSVDDDDAASFHGAARRLRQELDALDRTT